jgi:hypothetical protein
MLREGNSSLKAYARVGRCKIRLWHDIDLFPGGLRIVEFEDAKAPLEAIK